MPRQMRVHYPGAIHHVMNRGAAAREHRPTWICVDRLLGAHGIAHDAGAARAEFQLRMEARRAEESDEETLQNIRQGWCFGSQTFEQEMLERIDGALGEHHSGFLHSEGSQARAERIIGEELSRLGWTEQDLRLRRYS